MVLKQALTTSKSLWIRCKMSVVTMFNVNIIKTTIENSESYHAERV